MFKARVLCVTTLMLVGCGQFSSGGSGGGSSQPASPSIAVSVLCFPTGLAVLGTAQCTATVNNLSNTIVNWSVSGSGTGSISQGGVYTAPATVPSPSTITITATSQQQPSFSGTATITIIAPAEQSSVVLAITDMPASLVSILSAKVSFTGATLAPGDVPLFSGSTTVELTRLQTDITYLATAANVPAGTYTSITLTFANPSLTIENDTAAPVASCAVGAVCTITPS